jgi:hypothetical protein
VFAPPHSFYISRYLFSRKLGLAQKFVIPLRHKAERQTQKWMESRELRTQIR